MSNYLIDNGIARRCDSNLSMAENDLFGLLPDVNGILSISCCTVDGKSCRGEDVFEPLKELCESHGDMLILFTSALMVSEFPDEPSDSMFDEALDAQDKFLVANGFVSINDYVNYEYRRAYVYNNDLGKRVIDEIKNK